MSDDLLRRMCDLIQEDVGHRGLRTDPAENLVTACPDDFARACRSIAGHDDPSLVVVTGFYIPTADPPAGETDGPLGAVFLARALAPLGIRVAIFTDTFCERAVAAGLETVGLRRAVPVLTLPPALMMWEAWLDLDWRRGFQGQFPLTHVIALERVGPSHTPESVRGQPGTDSFLREVPPEHHDRCHTMRGRDITAHMAPAHRLFEHAARQEPR